MRVLLIYPLFPKSFWSFEKILELVDRKALLPPLGSITVAAILPQTWDFKLVDRNVREIREDEWDWAELVILSGMIVQKADMHACIREAKRREKLVAVGGPYATSLSHEVRDAGADFLILDEGEITLPMFVEAIKRGETHGEFRSGGEKPDVTITPIPRYDLLDLEAYDNLSIQFSRGCPFQCEFCDIIVLYGRKPRTKSPEQLLAELQYIYDLGWRRTIFMVDDNFIGNKRNVKLLLRALHPWMVEHGYPFALNTEASVDLAADPELLDLMGKCNFNAVFLGIETPDEDSLTVTRKYQNTRDPLAEAVDKIAAAGMRVMAGFIIGFDGEKPGAGRRVVDFVERTTIPTAMFSMLQALPDTALWHRLEREGRLLDRNANINQTTLINFVPTRPVEEIAREYIDAFWELYDPERYLDRAYRHFLKVKPQVQVPLRAVSWTVVKAMLIICWRQGVVRSTRWKFWHHAFDLFRRNPGVIDHYLAVCGGGEHFLEYRQIVRDSVEEQLAVYLEQRDRQPVPCLAEEAA